MSFFESLYTKRTYLRIEEEIEKSRKKEIEDKFKRLSKEWKEDTKILSNPVLICTHTKYLNIIGMGPEVISLILKDLQKSPDHWFIALSAITEENPINDDEAGNMQKMSDSWIKWGKERNYI